MLGLYNRLMHAWHNHAHSYAALIRFCLLGFVSGLPFALVTTTYQTWLATTNIPVYRIGLIGLVSLPYAMKPLWAVGVDWLRMRCGVANTTVYGLAVILLTLCFMGIARLHQVDDPLLISLMIMACFASATIDICVDAMRIISVAPSLQGLVSAWFVIFYRVAFILSGGLALVIVEYLGWQGLYQAMAVLTGVMGCAGYLLSRNTESTKTTAEVAQKPHFWQVIVQWLNTSRLRVLSALAFIFIYKFHGSFLASLLQVYLIKDAQMSLAFIGYTYKTVGMLATFAGGILAGTLTRYFSVKRGIQLTVLIQCIATGLFMLVHASQSPSEHYLLITLAMYMESLSIGTSTTLITIIITQQCQKDLAATQYAFFTAAIAWQRSLTTPIAAWVHSQWGWDGYFVVSMAVLPLVLLASERGAKALQANPQATQASVAATS